MPFTFSSVDFSMRFNIACIMLVYVMLSAFNPAAGKELYAEAAICRAFLFLSALPVALEHVFINMLNEGKVGSHPTLSIRSNKAKISVSLPSTSPFEIACATELKITSLGLHLLSPPWYRCIHSSRSALARNTRSWLLLLPHASIQVVYDILSGEHRSHPPCSNKPIILRRAASADSPRPSRLYPDMTVLKRSSLFFESSISFRSRSASAVRPFLAHASMATEMHFRSGRAFRFPSLT
mmetsp:Transcript_30027/g.63290  ORF Transcript_30027/g.63290 Transcript_30027/m.63290 type:complete len:238 (-) Transcript_30027:942-1655(-)